MNCYTVNDSSPKKLRLSAVSAFVIPLMFFIDGTLAQAPMSTHPWVRTFQKGPRTGTTFSTVCWFLLGKRKHRFTAVPHQTWDALK